MKMENFNNHIGLHCIACRHPLVPEGGGTVVCAGCGRSYAVEDGIVVLEEIGDVDLNMAATPPSSLHDVRRGVLNGAPIESEVDRVARTDSIVFADLHGEWLAPLLNDAVVADVGCGQIPYLGSLPGDRIRTYYGFDLERRSLEIARDNHDGGFDLRLAQVGAYNIPLEDDSVDAVISCEVIEHLERPHDYLAEIARVLKPGGVLSISTPCVSVYFHPLEAMDFFTSSKSRQCYLRRLNSHEHWQEVLPLHPALRPKAFRGWLEQAGFDCLRHETRLWYHGRIAWPFFSRLEKIGCFWAGKAYQAYLNFWNRMVRSGLPVLKWWGIRQFALCRLVDGHFMKRGE
ncbi:methyltransferase domain-containing protein [Salidesulfovibrio onnuriiensis]|uniref:methyltransferase domain-containing protein n=1 Tax=Salidesulfovibrio onnuriiensis TaxID=2583823 RepID=UPI0011CB2E22|nr:methyltransferase domain-containing protein [Salidesulfovibrio onnuriiensis]